MKTREQTENKKSKLESVHPFATVSRGVETRAENGVQMSGVRVRHRTEIEIKTRRVPVVCISLPFRMLFTGMSRDTVETLPPGRREAKQQRLLLSSEDEFSFLLSSSLTFLLSPNDTRSLEQILISQAGLDVYV